MKLVFRLLGLSIALVGVLVSVAPAAAQEEPSLGLSADVGLSTAYLFRGLNVFQKDGQMDQHMLLAPSLTYSVAGTAFQVGYWGAFQLNGDNASVNVDAGLGAEQDIFLAYSHAIAENLTLAETLTFYYYPLAKEDIAGTDHALFVEPMLSLTWASVVDVSMRIAYMHGVQDALKMGRYTYLSPTVSKTIEVSSGIGIVGTGFAGYKLFNEDGVESNVWDAGATIAVAVDLPAGLYVKPSVSLVWTNLESKDVGEELGFCGAVNVGMAL